MSTKKKKSQVVDTSQLYDTEMSTEMKQSYLNYAVSVISGRALPDVRDGFKPVNRRIMYAMSQLKLYPEKPHRKSARIVGDVLGRLHPHGDSAVYLAMVRMSQDFKNIVPLVDGHGNFGSIDGDSPAAMRYTEARLTPVAMSMLEELKYDVVDFVPNFDNEEMEPSVLPAKAPNLLINGSNGVAVGMATNIPTHNFAEVIDAYTHYLTKDNATIDDLCEIIKGPDFPTGGVIVNADEFNKSFYYTGEGKLRIRSKYYVEDIGYGKKNIVITEIPFTLSGNKSKLVEQIADMIANKKLDECTEVKDESNKEGIKIVIEVKKGVDIDNLIKKLLSKTKMEDSTGYTFLALNKDVEPITYNLETYFKEVYDFQKEVYRRKYNKILKNSLDRKEILDGYISAYDVIRVIVEVILNTKGSTKEETKSLIKNVLMTGDADYLESTEIMKKYIKIAKTFNFTERQANSIMSIPLGSLMHFEIESYCKELEKLLETINQCEKIINEDKELKKLIKKELKDLKKEYNTPRLTELANLGKESYKEMAVEEDLLVLVDKFEYIKVIDIPRNFNIEDYKDYKFAKVAKNTDSIRLFTTKANYIKVNISDLERGKLKDRGKPLSTYFELAKDEDVICYNLHSEIISNDLVIVTRKGFLKLMEGSNVDSKYTVLNYTKVDDDDIVADIKIVPSDSYYEVHIQDSSRSKKVVEKSDIKVGKRGAKGNLLRNVVTKDKKNKIKSLKIVEKEAPIKEKPTIESNQLGLDDIAFTFEPVENDTNK